MNIRTWIQAFRLMCELALVSLIMRILRVFETPEIKKAGIRPRLHVYGTLNLWRKYCGVSWQEVKRFKSFEILVIVVRHVRLIDDFVDDYLRPNNGLVDRKELRKVTRSLVSLLCHRIEALPVSKQTKARLIETFQDYRRKVTTAFIEEEDNGHDVSLAVVLQQRQDITGTVYVTLIRLLNLIHGIENSKAEEIQNIFARFRIDVQGL